MFDFLDSDWFNIALEIIFLILISWDIKRYFETRKKEYIINIVLTVAFAIWALYPYYNSYIEWSEEEKRSLLVHCDEEENATLCSCIDDAIFKNFTHDEYIKMDKNSSTFKEFLEEISHECQDDSWF